jgi:hypothetical protein
LITRVKSSSEAKQTIFITFAKQLTVVKRLLVKIWLSIEAVKTFIVSGVRLVRTFAAIILGGVWNAYLLSGIKGPPDSVVLRHVARGSDEDLTNFAALLGSIVAKPGWGGTRYLDLLLLADDTASVGKYLTIARFFKRRINLHTGRDVLTCRRIAPAIAVPSLVEQLCNFDTETVIGSLSSVSKGSFCVPPHYGNLAREFLKAVDPRKKYCLICVAEEWPLHTIQEIAYSFLNTHPIWRFIIMELRTPTTKVPAFATGNMIWPACAGLELGTKMALAAEADAVIGPGCLLALAAALAERPVTLLARGESTFKVSSDVRNVTAVNDFELSDLRKELNSLIDRVDEREFGF